LKKSGLPNLSILMHPTPARWLKSYRRLELPFMGILPTVSEIGGGRREGLR